MPSSKILTVLILCFGVIVSVWLFSEKSNRLSENLVQKNTEGSSVEPAININAEINDEWKKILTNVDTKQQKIIDLTKNNKTVDDDSTLTDQMSRDFLSQYLLTVKDGVEVTPEIADIIAKTTLALPEYNTSGVIYLKTNLNISTKKDSESLNQYKEDINDILQNVYFNVKNDPMVVLITALKKDSEEELKKLDPIILINKNTIKYLLGISVPEGAVNIHLDLINASSQILSDLESMRVVLSDPVRSFSALNKYPGNLNRYASVLSNLNIYLLNISKQ